MLKKFISNERRSKMIFTLSRLLRKCVLISFILTFVVSLMGCASGFTTIAPMPPKKYEKLGQATGKASGSLGILGTAYYFIPMGLNPRVDSAYENALKSVPKATMLLDVTIDESWFWWVIGTSRTVTITGEAIKEVTE